MSNQLDELKKIEKLIADAGFVGGYAVAGTELVLWEHDEDPPAPLTRPIAEKPAKTAK